MASRDTPQTPPRPAAKLPAPVPVGPGRVLGGRYRLEAPLAQGGMGTVYRATQLALGRAVAVKVLRADYQTRRPRDFHRRFAVEARAAARLAHPHSVTVLDYGSEPDGTYYLVMERLRGRTLGALLHEVGPMAPARALGIALQMGRAVQAAHATGIVHRDLKPANVLVLDWGEDAAEARHDFVKVLDFGLAKQFGAATASLTRTGQFLGSPGYMAPEQITGAELDGRCDVYALGAVLFEMLAGRPPFLGTSPHEVMRAHLHGEVPSLWPRGREGVTQLAKEDGAGLVSVGAGGLDGALAAQCVALEALVHRALAKRPDQRFASMGKMLEALHEAAALVSQASPPPWAKKRPSVASTSAPSAAREAHPTVARWLPAEAGVERTAVGGADLAGGRVAVRVRPPAAGMGAPLALAETRRGGRVLSAQARGRPPPPRLWRQRFATKRAAWLGAALCCALGQASLAPLRPVSTLPSSSVRLHLDSTPRGASVYADGRQVCSATPCTVAWPSPRASAAASSTDAPARVRLRFALAAHDDTLVQQRLPKSSRGAEVADVAVSARLR